MPRANGQLRLYRLQAGLSQEALALLAGVSTTTIRRAESGEDVRLRTLSGIVSALGDVLRLAIYPADILEMEGRVLTGVSGFSFSATVRDRIRTRMLEKEITRQDLAKSTGHSGASIARLLSGRQTVTFKTLNDFADALDFAIDELTFDDLGKIEEVGLERGRANQSNSDRDRKATLSAVAESIPDQSELVRFGVSEDGRLELIPTLQDENDYQTIEALRSEMLAEDGPIDYLKQRYANNPNAPQAQLFNSLTGSYDRELSKDPREINYAILYARGASFYAARKTAEKQVESGEWPDLDANESVAIDAICDLHGVLIMASGVGRRLVSNAHEYEATPQVYRDEGALFSEFGQALSSESELFEPDTLDAIEEIMEAIPGDPQPARSRGARVILVGSALVAIVGGVAWKAAGGVVASVVVPAAAVGAAGLVGGFMWEVLKKTKRFKHASDDAAKLADDVFDQVEAQAIQKENALLERLSDFVKRNRGLFARVADLRPEFGWVKEYVSRDRSEAPEAHFNVFEAILNATTGLESRIRLKRGVIGVEAKHPHMFAIGDLDQIVSALENVVGEAINLAAPYVEDVSMETSQMVTIKAYPSDLLRAEGHLETIRVDVGIPRHVIPHEQLPRLFEQLHTNQENDGKVPEFDLFLAREIVSRYQGRISVSTDASTGTSFSFHFKAHSDP